MTVTLLVMTDGRAEYLRETLASFDAMVTPQNLVTRRVIHNDSPEPGFAAWLASTYPEYEHVRSWQSIVGKRSGFGGSIRSAWSHLRSFPGPERHLLTLEDDFTFNRPVPIDQMAAVLDLCPYLAQLCLRRQPWNDVERAAGGIVESHPESYTEVFHHLQNGRPVVWLEQRMFFSTNVNLAPISIVEQDWPDVEHSEGAFSARLLDDPKVRFAYWGSRASEPWVTHIGEVRTGTGY